MLLVSYRSYLTYVHVVHVVASYMSLMNWRGAAQAPRMDLAQLRGRAAAVVRKLILGIRKDITSRTNVAWIHSLRNTI